MEEFEDEAHELGWASVGVGAADVGEGEGVVDQGGRVEGEAVLLCSQ